MDQAAFQVIVLGPTGGPREDCVTGLLVRSTSTKWSRGSVVAVDAGTLLAGIIRALERYINETNPNGKGVMKEGPFVGLDLPNVTAQANAAYIFREIIGAVLITHPHLDHLAGLAINTPLVEAGNGPKTVAALPSVIAAIKNHMFNDIIWPNLSDEDGGAGLVTYQRLVEGGNPRFGQGDARGYVRACEALVTKCISVSHGRCRQQYHPETGRHHRVGSAVFAPDPMMLSTRTISVDHGEGSVYSPARSSSHIANAAHNNSKDLAAGYATVESSAFFIRDTPTGSEIIVFGDIEPDSLALEPRNKRVWEIAAPKVVSGCLRAIFIECSFNDSIDDNSLYGHLCPRHLIAELKVLATKVLEEEHQHYQHEHQQKRQQRASTSASVAGDHPSYQRRGRSSKRKRRDSEYGEDQAGVHANSNNTNSGNGIENNNRNSNISPHTDRSLPHLPAHKANKIDSDVSPGRVPTGTPTRGRGKSSESTRGQSSLNKNPFDSHNNATSNNNSHSHHSQYDHTNHTDDQGGEPPDLVHEGDHTPGIYDPVDAGDDDRVDEERDGVPVDTIKDSSLHDHMMQGVRWADSWRQPLAGLSIYIIHIKDELTDGPPPGDRILQELRTQGEDADLGCEFFITKRGEGIWI